jgi:lysophospholipase L1-like esterase
MSHLESGSFSHGRRNFLAGLVGCAGAAAAAGALCRDAGANDDSAPRRPAVDGLEGIKALLAGKEPVMWVITGDSITHGALHTLGWRSYPEHFAERVRWELRRVRDIVINTGISGDRIPGVLADLDWRVLQFRPHVVSLMFGMNDCSAGPDGRDKFRADLGTLVTRIREAGAIPLLNTPNTVYIANAQSRSDLPAYAEIVREYAVANEIALVDHWQHWLEAKPNQEDLLAWIEDKSIHPGVYGHREFAKEIFRVLGIYDEKSPTCMLEVP